MNDQTELAYNAFCRLEEGNVLCSTSLLPSVPLLAHRPPPPPPPPPHPFYPSVTVLEPVKETLNC